jgi:hypothetical protein
MNAVEIEEAVSRLAEAPFNAEAFPFAFLEAFGNKPTTLKKLQSTSGSSNQSDLPGGVLQLFQTLTKKFSAMKSIRFIATLLPKTWARSALPLIPLKYRSQIQHETR